MSELTEWLTAQLDGDERIARDLSAEAWQVASRRSANAYGGPYAKVDVGGGRIAWETGEALDEPVAEHIARHDPAAVLADIAVKRAILAHHDRYGEDDHYIRLLATAYAHREGYREEWKP